MNIPGKGTGIEISLFIKYLTTSFLTGVSRGASLSFQSGINSFSAVGSKTFPESICAPTSEPFSITQIV